jgi:hypothetical protein
LVLGSFIPWVLGFLVGVVLGQFGVRWTKLEAAAVPVIGLREISADLIVKFAIFAKRRPVQERNYCLREFDGLLIYGQFFEFFRHARKREHRACLPVPGSPKSWVPGSLGPWVPSPGSRVPGP